MYQCEEFDHLLNLPLFPDPIIIFPACQCCTCWKSLAKCCSDDSMVYWGCPTAEREDWMACVVLPFHCLFDWKRKHSQVLLYMSWEGLLNPSVELSDVPCACDWFGTKNNMINLEIILGLFFIITVLNGVCVCVCVFEPVVLAFAGPLPSPSSPTAFNFVVLLMCLLVHCHDNAVLLLYWMQVCPPKWLSLTSRSVWARSVRQTTAESWSSTK